MPALGQLLSTLPLSSLTSLRSFLGALPTGSLGSLSGLLGALPVGQLPAVGALLDGLTQAGRTAILSVLARPAPEVHAMAEVLAAA